MNKEGEKLILLNALFWNIGLIILSGFCCWYFKSIIGLIPLLGMKSYEYKSESKTTKEL